jgi:hypothetical protein
MNRYAEVAPEERVRRQFADLQHHIDTQVHPKLRLEILEQGARSARYVQQVRLLGFWQRDVFERSFTADGTMIDSAVEGFNRGGTLRFRFSALLRGGVPGTEVEITVRLPLPPLVGPLLRPLLERQIGRELRGAAAEDKHDLELRGYPRAAEPARRAA